MEMFPACSPSTYKPFSFCRHLEAYHSSLCRRETHSCLDTAKKVTQIVWTLLVLMPAFIVIDVLLFIPTLPYRTVCVRSAPPLPQAQRVLIGAPAPALPAAPPIERLEAPAALPLPPVQVQQAPAPPPPKEPNEYEVEDLIRNPYPNGHFPNNGYFLSDSIRGVLARMNLVKRNQYRELLENRGVDNRGEPGEIEIFHWAAGCVLMEYIRYATHAGYHANVPDFLEYHLRIRQENQPKTLVDLINDYRLLPNKQKAALINQIRFPEEVWNLDEDARSLRQDIQAIALLMTRNQQFTGPLGRAFPAPLG
ncbi:MAG TPA: hypothetical protein VLE95_07160 [Chlamydiales bacterium]|nr:hypothetical protein [Chlamydiales bacterium]